MPPMPSFFAPVAVAALYLAVWSRPKALAAVAAAHAVILIWGMHPAYQLGLGAALSAFMLATLAVNYAALRFPATRRLLASLTAAAILMPPLLPPPPTAPTLTAHAILALAAYVAAAGGAAHWLDMRAAEKRLRQAPRADLTAPLLRGEKWCFRHVAIAFALLTLTIASGGWNAAQTGAGAALTHKNLFAVVSWLTFLALLLGRRLRGWRGQTARRWFFAGAVFLLLSYVGSAFVLQVILQRG